MKRVILAFALFGLCSVTLAQSGDQAELFSGKTIRRLAKIGVSTVPAKGEALVYIPSGGASGRIIIVSSQPDPKGDLKKRLDPFLSSLVEDGLEPHPEGPLTGRWNHSKLWLTQASLTLPLRELDKALKERGMKPLFVLKIPDSVKMSQDLRKEQGGLSWSYRIVKDPTFDLTLSASITPLDVLGAGFFFFWPFLVISGSFLAAAIQAKKKDLTPSQKKRVYTKILMISLGLAIIPHAPFAFHYIAGGGLNTYSDLWLGGASVSSFASLLIMAPVLLLGVLSRPLTKIEKEEFGPKAELAVLSEARISSFEQVIKKYRLFTILSSAAALLPASVMIVYGINSDQKVWPVIGFGLVIISFAFGDQAAILLMGDPRLTSSVPELKEAEAAACLLAQKLGVPSPRVIPEVRNWFLGSHVPVAEGRNLAVNPSFVAAFPPEEQEYWLAYALVSHAKGTYDLLRLSIMVVPLLIAAAFFALNSRTMGPAALILLLALPVMAFVYLKGQRKKLPGAEVEAALLTENLPAALAATKRLWLLSCPSDAESTANMEKELENLKTGYQNRGGGCRQP